MWLIKKIVIKYLISCVSYIIYECIINIYYKCISVMGLQMNILYSFFLFTFFIVFIIIIIT